MHGAQLGGGTAANDTYLSSCRRLASASSLSSSTDIKLVVVSSPHLAFDLAGMRRVDCRGAGVAMGVGLVTEREPSVQSLHWGGALRPQNAKLLPFPWDGEAAAHSAGFARVVQAP